METSSPLKRIVAVQFLSQTQATPKPQLSVPKTEVFGKRSHRAGSLPAGRGHSPAIRGGPPRSLGSCGSLGVGERRARQLMSGCNAIKVGNAMAIRRTSLLERLE